MATWTPSEHDEQKVVVAWADRNAHKWPELSMLFAIPNGGHRHKAVAARLKAEGVRRGVPDLCLPTPRGTYRGLWLELKTKKGTLTPEQRWWLLELAKQGYCALWARGADRAIYLLQWYLDGAKDEPLVVVNK